jgi:hypothetical protein
MRDGLLQAAPSDWLRSAKVPDDRAALPCCAGALPAACGGSAPDGEGVALAAWVRSAKCRLASLLRRASSSSRIARLRCDQARRS